MKPRRRAPASIYRRWHRLLALLGAGFVIFLVVTGMALNHADSLGLDQRQIKQAELLAWYGLRGPTEMKSIAVANRILTWAGRRLFLDDQEVTTTDGSAVGAVGLEGLIVAAGHRELLLLTDKGELVERVEISELGSGVIDRLGLTQSGRVAIRSGQGVWQGDRDLLTWSPLLPDSESVKWAALIATDKALHERISGQYLGPGVSWQRFLLDLHSGRLFGPYGVLVFDLLALILLALAVSGLILWQRGRGNGRSNGK